MESLLASLHNLGLRPPSPSQLLPLLDAEAESRRRLAQLLSLNNVRDDEDDDGRDDADGSGDERVVGAGTGGVDDDGDGEARRRGGGAAGRRPGEEPRAPAPASSSSSMAALMGQELLREAVEALLDNLAAQIQAQRRNAERQAHLLTQPQRFRRVPRNALLARHAAELRRSQERHRQLARFWPKLVFDGGRSYTSHAGLADLARMGVADMDLVPSRYQGRYLLCRVLTPVNHYVGASFLVEDFRGDVVGVAISHFSPDPQESSATASSRLPVGAVLAIREPYLSTHHLERTGPCCTAAQPTPPTVGVRVDSPTDVVVLAESIDAARRPRRPGEGEGEVHAVVASFARELLEGVEWHGSLEPALEAPTSPRSSSASPAREGEGQTPLPEPPVPRDGVMWLRDGPLSRLVREDATAAAHPFVASSSSSSSTADANGTATAARLGDVASRVRWLLRERRPGAAWRELCAASRLGVDGEAVRASAEPMSSAAAAVKLEIVRLRGETLLELGAYEEAAREFGRLEGHQDQGGAGAAEGKGGTDVRRLARRRAPDHVLDTTASLDAAEMKRRCLGLAREARDGPSQSTVARLYFGSRSSATPRLAAAHHVSHAVRVESIAGSGRGLVVTAGSGGVEAGEVVLCCKAVASAYPDDAGSRSSPVLRLNLDNGVVSTTSQVCAQTRLIHALVDRPELIPAVMGLTAGPQLAHSPWVERPYPLRVDAVVDAAASLGGYPRSGVVDVDALYVDGVLRFNAFGPSQSPVRKGRGGRATSARQVSRRSGAADVGEGEVDGGGSDAGEVGRSTMPHPLPAILNHACVPNVSSVFFGDVVVTRALRRLEAGEEVVHPYVRGEEALGVRRAQLSKHAFECGCALCVEERADGEARVAARARLVAGQLPAVMERSRVVAKAGAVPATGQAGTRSGGFGSSNGRGRRGDDDDGEEAAAAAADEWAKRRDAHVDVAEALEAMAQRIAETYDDAVSALPTRSAAAGGKCAETRADSRATLPTDVAVAPRRRRRLRPALFDVYVAAARHRAQVHDVASAVRLELEALRSVGAEPARTGTAVATREGGHHDGGADVRRASGAGDDVALKHAPALRQMPLLHLDGAVACMLRLATLHDGLKEPEARDAWLASALGAHECMVGGGLEVFLDRWGGGVGLGGGGAGEKEEHNDGDDDGEGESEGETDGEGVDEGGRQAGAGGHPRRDARARRRQQRGGRGRGDGAPMDGGRSEAGGEVWTSVLSEWAARQKGMESNGGEKDEEEEEEEVVE